MAKNDKNIDRSHLPNGGQNPTGQNTNGKVTPPAGTNTPAATTTNTPPAPVVRTHAIVEAEMEKAFAAKPRDGKLISKLAAELAKIDAAHEAAEREAKVKALVAIETEVKKAIMAAIEPFIKSKKLDVAEGVWFAYDFGDKSESIRLLKGSAKKSKTGEGGGGGSYVSRPEKTADLLNQVGAHVMFKEDTVVTIDKQEVTMKAGTTLKQAFDYSNNGGWRNRVRMALLKEAGLI